MSKRNKDVYYGDLPSNHLINLGKAAILKQIEEEAKVKKENDLSSETEIDNLIKDTHNE